MNFKPCRRKIMIKSPIDIYKIHILNLLFKHQIQNNLNK